MLKMNNLFKSVAVFCAACAMVVGCDFIKTLPTDEQMTNAAKAIGTAAGLVANAVDIDATARVVVVDIVSKVESSVPETNQTFAAAWTPIAQQHVAKLVEDKKLDAAQGQLVVMAFTTAVDGIDYVFDVRYPEAKQHKNLVSAATHGFCTGFLSAFKKDTSTMMSAAPVASQSRYDAKAYEWLKERSDKRFAKIVKIVAKPTAVSPVKK